MGGGKSVYGTINTANPTHNYHMYAERHAVSSGNSVSYSMSPSHRTGAYGRRAAPMQRLRNGAGGRLTNFQTSQARGVLRDTTTKANYRTSSITRKPATPIRNGSNNNRLVRTLQRATNRQTSRNTSM